MFVYAYVKIYGDGRVSRCSGMTVAAMNFYS